MVKESSTSASLKEYLKRYESNIEEDKKKKKKKKKKTEVKTDSRGVVVVDEDPVWQKPVNLDEEEDDSADEEKPQVDEDIEVKRMKRLEQLRSRRPFGVISEDGSGWVPVSENSRNLRIDDQVCDISPKRRRRTRNDTPSPERRPSLTENTDLSPPRSQQTSSANLSRPRKQRTRNDTPSAVPDWQPSKVDVDLSPPRKRRARNDSPSPEPDLKHLGSSVDDDLSPPRQRRKQNQIAPQESHRSALDNDGEIPDLSPPRRMKKVTPLEKERPKTGLVSGREIKEEITKTKEEEWFRFKNLDPSVSGRGAEPVYRNKITGERMSKEEFLKSREKKKEEKPKEIKLEWGKGLAQKRESEQEMRELELEKEKPFARTRDDPDLDKELKERVRWGDPMAHLVKRKPLESVLPDLGNNDKMKESGFIIPQEVPSHSWIIRGIGAPPNRYGIKPGRHWDGVDRSTGFEKESFKRTNEKQATEKEAYLWSVADM
ncbi:hypothetical protein Leryth_018409 [Lithospermum erythrorhizon]|nr:hypothetical protein Leryth_018409 [Lithospermum erythrorhizon]